MGPIPALPGAGSASDDGVWAMRVAYRPQDNWQDLSRATNTRSQQFRGAEFNPAPRKCWHAKT